MCINVLHLLFTNSLALILDIFRDTIQNSKSRPIQLFKRVSGFSNFISIILFQKATVY